MKGEAVISNRVFREAIGSEIVTAAETLRFGLGEFDTTDENEQENAAALLAAVDRLGTLCSSLQFALFAEYGRITADLISLRKLMQRELKPDGEDWNP